jgi:hypothetical protein
MNVKKIELVMSVKDNVLNVVTHEGYKLLDQQTQRYSEFFSRGMSLTEATNAARKLVPDPPRISFAMEQTMPLRSPNGNYGHAGYYDLFEQLMDTGRYHPVGGIIKVYNLGEWNLPTPTDPVFTAIFGKSALPIYWAYQKAHGY